MFHRLQHQYHVTKSSKLGKVGFPWLGETNSYNLCLKTLRIAIIGFAVKTL